MKFPDHKASLSLEHNYHKSVYETLEYYLETTELYFDWISEEDKQLCLETEELWVLTWYPDTPVGSYSIGGSSLEVVLDAANKIGVTQ